MASLEGTNFDNTDEVSLKELILKTKKLYSFVLSKLVIILFTGLLGATLGITYSYLKKPVYTAELSFALEDDKAAGGGLGSALGLASQFGFDLGGSGGGAFSGDNLLQLIKSRSMVEKTLLTPVTIDGKLQTLADFYISFNKFHAAWQNKPGLRDIQYLPNYDRSKFTLQQDSILGVFYTDITKSNLSVDKADKKLSIINVVVTSKNENFSKFFTEVLVKTVSDFYIVTKTKKSTQNVNILQKQTDSVRRELNSAITGVASFGDANPNANPALQILRAPSQRRQVDVQANQAILTELVKNLEISKVSLRKETPLIQIIDRPILPLKKDKVGHLAGGILGFIIASILAVVAVITKKVYINILSGE